MEQLQDLSRCSRSDFVGGLSVGVIREMARIDPEERASAAQTLVKCFNGKGLTTPRNQVLSISPTKDNSKAPTANADDTPTAASPALTGKAQPQRRDFRRNVNPAAGQVRVDKAWFPQAQLRQPGGPPTKRLAGQAFGAQAPVNYRVPGSFPDDTIDVAETRKRPRFT